MQTRKSWKAALAAMAVFAGALAGPGSVAVIAAPNSEYWLGSATVDVTPELGVPLAGYGGAKRRIIPWDFFDKHEHAHFFKPSTGVHDPIRAKALVVAEGEKKVLFLSLDVIGVEGDFVADVREFATDLGIADLVVSATHTHSGPGSIGRNGFFGILATDRFEPKIYRRFLAGVFESIERATLAMEPVTLYRAQFDVEGLQSNRRDHPGEYDRRATLVYGKNPAGETVGGFVNFAVHPTVYGQKDRLFSADLAGGIERHLGEILGAKHTILFLNGAEGDVSPNADGEAGIETKSAAFALAARDAVATATVLPIGIEVRRGEFKMPKGKIRLAQCMKLPKPLRGIKIGGKRWFPREFEVSQIELGDLLFVTWPGEPTTALGEAAKRLAEGRGHAAVVNLGLTNGYHGYFLTETEFGEGGYETCVAYHGPKAGQTILDAHAELLRR